MASSAIQSVKQEIQRRLPNANVRAIGNASEANSFMDMLGIFQSNPPARGTPEMLNSYSTMPWLRAVVDKIGSSVATTVWRVFVRVKVDDEGATKVEGVWAGGDVTDLALVTDAVGPGRRAAEAMVKKFTGIGMEPDARTVIKTDQMNMQYYRDLPKERNEPPALDLDKRMDLDTEVNLGLSQEQTVAEAERCMSCGYCFDCENCWLYCSDQAITKPLQKGLLYGWKLENCTGCDKCADICPCGFIEMH